MSGWPTSSLGEVCEIVSGATPKTGNPDFWGGDVLWVTPKDLGGIDHKFISDTPRKITEAGLKSCSANMLPSNSVLFSSRAPIGLVVINAVPVCTNQGFKSMVPRNGRVSADYLYWWLRIHRESIQRKGRGATFKELSKKIVEEIQIPLPPLAEQKRIAGILDAADALRAKRRESLTQLDTLLQSTFLNMFGDPVTNPMGWEVMTIENAPLHIGDGNYSSKYPKASDFITHGVPFIRANNISSNTVIGDHMRFISEEQHSELKKGHLVTGDVLITTRGDVGQVAIVPAEFDDANINAQLVLLRPTKSSISSRYLCHLLSASSLRQKIKSLETGVALKQLPIRSLKKISLIVPPVDLQRRFAVIVESIEQQKANQRAHLEELDTLFASLQSRAFRGDL